MPHTRAPTLPTPSTHPRHPRYLADSDQSILQTFSLCTKNNVSQTFKNSSCKKIFPKCVYHWYNLFWRHYFLYKFLVTQRFGTIAMLLHSLKEVFWKKTAFYIRYLHNNITMLLTPKAQIKASTSYMFLTKFICW